MKPKDKKQVIKQMGMHLCVTTFVKKRKKDAAIRIEIQIINL